MRSIRFRQREEVFVHSDPEKALGRFAEDTRTLEEGLETELRDDVEEAKGEEVRSDLDATT
jgi:hypothetical protein